MRFSRIGLVAFAVACLTFGAAPAAHAHHTCARPWVSGNPVGPCVTTHIEHACVYVGDRYDDFLAAEVCFPIIP